MKNAATVHVFYEDNADNSVQQSIVPIPKEVIGEDDGPSFEWIRETAGMKPDTFLAIKIVSLDGSKKGIMFVDEDAPMKNPRPRMNSLASQLANEPILGPAVVWQGRYLL